MESSAPLSLDGAGVLIVDEDPAFQLGLKTFLREFVGFTSVQVAKNGKEALRLLREDPSIVLVTLDYRMPEMDGLGVLERLREDPPRPLSVVMITGYPSDRLEDDYRSFHSPMLRAEHFVAKPVDFATLEPVLLRAYESLQSAPPAAPSAVGDESPLLNAAVAEAVGSGTLAAHSAALEALQVSMTGQMEALGNQISQMQAQLDSLSNRTPPLMTRFWLLALGWLAAAAVAFLAYQMCWFAEIGDWIEKTLLTAPPDGGGIGSGEPVR